MFSCCFVMFNLCNVFLFLSQITVSVAHSQVRSQSPSNKLRYKSYAFTQAAYVRSPEQTRTTPATLVSLHSVSCSFAYVLYVNVCVFRTTPKVLVAFQKFWKHCCSSYSHGMLSTCKMQSTFLTKLICI